MRRDGTTPGGRPRFEIAAGLVTAGLIALAFGVVAAADRGPVADSQSALNEGNRLFREGRIEAAVAAYLEGHSPAAPHPTLLYNLGTALHHLDRLPEAILWYRRAAGSDDPWLEENLWLARRILGSQTLPVGGSVGWLCRHADSLRLAGTTLAWLTLLVVVVSSKTVASSKTASSKTVASSKTLGWSIAAALVASSLYLGAAAIERWGPRPAVVLEDCFTSTAELPAGTEVWVRPTSDDGWLISGSDAVVCPPESVELVFP